MVFLLRSGVSVLRLFGFDAYDTNRVGGELISISSIFLPDLIFYVSGGIDDYLKRALVQEQLTYHKKDG